ncbi:MAG: hypothetical protein ACP5OU_03845 [Methanothrix sp.]
MVFKHVFDGSEIFKELADHYNKDFYRSEFKTVGERNKALTLGAARLRGGAGGGPQGPCGQSCPGTTDTPPC